MQALPPGRLCALTPWLLACVRKVPGHSRLESALESQLDFQEAPRYRLHSLARLVVYHVLPTLLLAGRVRSLFQPQAEKAYEGASWLAQSAVEQERRKACPPRYLKQ